MKNIKTYRYSLLESEDQERQNKRLISAASNDDIERMIDALDKGADVNYRSQASVDGGRTSLHLAAAYGLSYTCRLLIERGARLNEVDENGATPLHLAAGRGNREIVEVLLDAGADIDPVNTAGSTPLRYAAKNRKDAISRLLIERGADPFKAFKNPEEIIEFFKGDVEWMPEQTKSKLMRMQRGRSAFGM